MCSFLTLALWECLRWKLLAVVGQDPFTQLAAMWLGTPLGQARLHASCALTPPMHRPSAACYSLLAPEQPLQGFQQHRWLRSASSSTLRPKKFSRLPATVCRSRHCCHRKNGFLSRSLHSHGHSVTRRCSQTSGTTPRQCPMGCCTVRAAKLLCSISTQCSHKRSRGVSRHLFLWLAPQARAPPRWPRTCRCEPYSPGFC